MREDAMAIEILEDGTVRIEVVGSITGPNHAAAENVLGAMARMLGGEVTKAKLPHAHAHAHAHEHERGKH